MLLTLNVFVGKHMPGSTWKENVQHTVYNSQDLNKHGIYRQIDILVIIDTGSDNAHAESC